jgi:hypothetical protein
MRLSKLLANDKLDDLVLINQLGVDEINKHSRIKHHFWRYGTRAHKQSFCPECLKENGYHKNIWELLLLVVCPIHNCQMIDKCEGCGKNISPYRQSLLFCRCGYDYRLSKVVKLESFFANYLHHIFIKNHELPPNLSVINNISVSSFLYLMIVASRWVIKPYGERRVSLLF